jgi:hypothetical protein
MEREGCRGVRYCQSLSSVPGLRIKEKAVYITPEVA